MSKLGEQTVEQVIPASNVQLKTKKKRKKKDLEQLRFNALKARRKRGREKSATGKLSYKNKIRSSITALKNNETPGLTNENGRRMEDKTLCNRLLPEPCIGIYRNGAKSKQLAKEKSVCSFDEKKKIIPQDVMQLFNKDPPSKSNENNPMETPNTFTENNESAIEVVQSVKRWRWSPFTCFEELCVKICSEKFDGIPIKGFPDPLQKGQILLVDFHMEPHDYSHEIETKFTFGKNGKPTSKKVIVDAGKNRVITGEAANGISKSERTTKFISSRIQVAEKHNTSPKVPDFIEFSKHNFDTEHSPQTFVKYIPTMGPSYCPTPSCIGDSVADKFLRNYRTQEGNDRVETPNLVERTARNEDFLRKGKFNSVKAKHSVTEVNERNTKRNEMLYRSNSQGSKKFRSSFGGVRNPKAHSRNKRNRHHNPEFDETEIQNNAVLHNFQVLSFSDDQSRDLNRSTEKQLWRNSEGVQQPVKYFALKNESGLLNVPRPIPIYEHENGWKNPYINGNLEQKNYRTQNSKSTTAGRHNKIVSFNSGMWITPEPQRNKFSKSFNEAVTNNNVGIIPPNYFDRNYQPYANNFHSIYREGHNLHPTVTFNDTSSYHYY